MIKKEKLTQTNEMIEDQSNQIENIFNMVDLNPFVEEKKIKPLDKKDNITLGFNSLDEMGAFARNYDKYNHPDVSWEHAFQMNLENFYTPTFRTDSYSWSKYLESGGQVNTFGRFQAVVEII